MRTIFTLEDIKHIVDSLYNGNLWASKRSGGQIPYKNPNSPQIVLIDADTGEQKSSDLAQYLNLEFYTWRKRLVEQHAQGVGENPQFTTFSAWVKSLNFSMDKAYALVEQIDSEVTASQDIDNGTITARITFLIQTDKIANLEYYTSKLRNEMLGVPQQIQNSFGEELTAYVLLGMLIYDEEPLMTQVGEAVIVSCNFKISYLGNAQTYANTQVEISLDGDDLYNDEGEIVNAVGEPTETKYLKMPITQHTWQNIFGDNPLITDGRPDLTGFVATAISTVKTITFYDFNKPLTERFNQLFWEVGAYRVDGKIKAKKEPNIPVYVRVTNGGHKYVYKDMISQMQKQFVNNDFTISSITLKGWGKIQNLQTQGV